MRVVFRGLGAMGAPMAARLAGAGYTVVPIDHDPAVQRRWVAAYGAHALDPGAADVAITCVTDEAALVAARDALLDGLQPGALWIDHTTASAVCARELAAACAARGVAFVDAPVSGGPEGAAAGRLVVMAGGQDGDVARARGVLAAYASRVVHLGGPGTGQLAKLANQVAIAGTVRGLAEAVALGRAGGLDAGRLLEALGAGNAASVQLERTRAAWVAGEPFERAFAWLGKDLVLALDEAGRRDTALPVAERIAAILGARP